MRLFTDKQITEILKETHWLKYVLSTPEFNTPTGESLIRSVQRIEDHIFLGDEVKPMISKYYHRVAHLHSNNGDTHKNKARRLRE
jgi:hypothetical protein